MKYSFFYLATSYSEIPLRGRAANHCSTEEFDLLRLFAYFFGNEKSKKKSNAKPTKPQNVKG